MTAMTSQKVCHCQPTGNNNTSKQQTEEVTCPIEEPVEQNVHPYFRDLWNNQHNNLAIPVGKGSS